MRRPTFRPFFDLGPAQCLWLVLSCGLSWSVAAQANPNLYVCPGPLFTNDLAPAQAKVRGCELAAQGRLSQAHNLPMQGMPTSETDPRSSPDVTVPGPASAPPLTPTSAQPFVPASISPLTAPSATFGATPGSMPATAPSSPAGTAARQTAQPSADASRQRQRDSHARDIVLAELARTQARIQTLSAQPPSGPEAESALLRLRLDEDALRRELARRPG